jgi:phenylpyruvate tautomerase PptA (4-oxalocrotonate tautomerase family)
MPTYVCTTSTGRLNKGQKEQIVQKVTRVHSQEGGNVPEWLVQVIFKEVERGNIYINKRNADDQVWIRGDIRAGRSDAQKTAMVERMMNECAEAIGIDKSYIWVYICDADKTAEFGEVLPEPGQEEAWVARLPKEVRDRYFISAAN